MRAVLYWIAQIVGSILGSACVYAVSRPAQGQDVAMLGHPVSDPGISVESAGTTTRLSRNIGAQ